MIKNAVSGIACLSQTIQDNAQYAENLVNMRALKARLDTLEQPGLPSRKLKEQEQLFLEHVNTEVSKVNDVCSMVVLKIEDALTYLTRELSKPDLDKKHVSVLYAECDSLLGELVTLDEYVRVSESSFNSTIKKHDSIVGANSSAWFESQLQVQYFTNIHFHTMLLKIANLYSEIRKVLDPPPPTSKKPETVRQFWVRKEHLLRVQSWILRHLPMTEVHNQKIKEREEDHESEIDPAISVVSIYFDGPKFELYNNFLHSLHDSKLVRVSWNGEERQEPRISFQSQSGISDTIPIKYKYISPFLTGEWHFNTHAQKLLKQNRITKEMHDQMIMSAASISSMIKEKSLRMATPAETVR
eukprot:TRINITY_DN30616_c0_g1_i1.p1 TRINITY_DN30616_c0_g1~~TRINITY_DN30616_c0_g1_i1.p1  ORF type:complete len:356 (-),score=49.45 TRINITY_DN30616_c0_g1_i1:95-1162(-)